MAVSRPAEVDGKVEPRQVNPDNVLQLAQVVEHLDSSVKCPRLQTYNGCGTSLLGSYPLPASDTRVVTMACICALFLPIWPIGIYLVKETAHREYQVYGCLPIRAFVNIFGRAALRRLVVTAIAEGLLRLVLCAVVVAAVGGLFYLLRRRH